MYLAFINTLVGVQKKFFASSSCKKFLKKITFSFRVLWPLKQYFYHNFLPTSQTQNLSRNFLFLFLPRRTRSQKLEQHLSNACWYFLNYSLSWTSTCIREDPSVDKMCPRVLFRDAHCVTKKTSRGKTGAPSFSKSRDQEIFFRTSFTGWWEPRWRS